QAGVILREWDALVPGSSTRFIGTDKVERRRIIDFAAGMVYGLNGSIDVVSTRVFRLTPNGVRLPRE
ncbi:MAG: cell division protein SepF, partial [Acidimicrobiia bacterium]|nr:cell division protein SepF [Acidimicrobiia bacterium]